MRKLYEATGGQPQRWESLGNLGAVKADAAGIAYAVEMDWLIGGVAMKYGSIEFSFPWRTIWELCAVLAVCVVIGVFAAAMTGLLEWLLT